VAPGFRAKGRKTECPCQAPQGGEYPRPGGSDECESGLHERSMVCMRTVQWLVEGRGASSTGRGGRAWAPESQGSIITSIGRSGGDLQGKRQAGDREGGRAWGGHARPSCRLMILFLERPASGSGRRAHLRVKGGGIADIEVTRPGVRRAGGSRTPPPVGGGRGPAPGECAALLDGAVGGGGNDAAALLTSRELRQWLHRAPGRESRDPAPSHIPAVARAARQKGATPSGTAPFDPINAAH